MGLAGVEVVCTVPLGAYSIYLNSSAEPIQRWVSWANTHYDFSRVGQYPSVVWHENQLTVISIQLSRYFIIICALIFFAFFGFADEAKKNYRLAYESVAKRVGLSTGSMSTTGTWTANGSKPDMSYNSRSGTMPVFITQRTERKRDSLASFSTDLSLGDFGGALDDVKKDSYSPTASGGSISKETLPISPVDSNDIPLPTLPEPSLDINAVPRHIPDAPESRRSSIDVV
jgi:pheromone a factor receptor